MRIQQQLIEDFNQKYFKDHQQNLEVLSNQLEKEGIDVQKLIKKIEAFQIAIPSWAMGTGGTRFGRFPMGGEPSTLDQKLEDVGLLHALSKSCDSISLHIPWDIPDDTKRIKNLADEFGIGFDAVNSNTFQNQSGQKYSYKFGSLSHTDSIVRQQAIDHNVEVIKIGNELGSKSITVWLADGSNFPGQQNFRKALSRTLDALKAIYKTLPADWKMFVEYKPFEPNFYSMVIPDWGTSHLLASKLGEKAFCLVDLGHHLPNTNIEQIVATLMLDEKLGGFHFNDSKFSDDDLTVGSIKPYQLFLIFNELVEGMENKDSKNPYPSWMIDASHNIKDPLEDLLQSVEAINTAYVKALLVNRNLLEDCREKNDVAMAQEILQTAFSINVKPLITQSRLNSGGAIDPISFYRIHKVREQLIQERGENSTATGL